MSEYDLKRCHFCDRIAEFEYDDLPVCNRCMAEYSGNEWDLWQFYDGGYIAKPSKIRDEQTGLIFLNTGTFDEMWKLMLELCADLGDVL